MITIFSIFQQNVHGSIPCNHRIEFLIGNHVLPYSMTIYEAIRLYSPVLARNHNGQCLSTAQIWGLTHILQLVMCYFVIKINVESLTISYY